MRCWARGSRTGDKFLPLPLRAWAAKRTKLGGRGPVPRYLGSISAATPPPAPSLKGRGRFGPGLALAVSLSVSCRNAGSAHHPERLPDRRDQAGRRRAVLAARRRRRGNAVAGPAGLAPPRPGAVPDRRAAEGRHAAPQRPHLPPGPARLRPRPPIRLAEPHRDLLPAGAA